MVGGTCHVVIDSDGKDNNADENGTIDQDVNVEDNNDAVHE